MIITANALQIGVCWALVAFTVSTVALAVQNAKYKADLKDLKDKLDYLETELEGEVQPRGRITRETEELDYRLPKSLKPIHYEITMRPDIENGVFSGQEAITISVIEATNQIILHSTKLNITSVSVDDYEVKSHSFDEVREFLILELATELQANSEIKLHTQFNGQMLGKLSGFYSSSYVTQKMETRKMATTLFAPIDARQTFPCFDEPAMKANFTVSVVYPDEGFHALSNMNEVSSQVNNEKLIETRFAVSVPMSTYLVCFIVSDLLHESRTVEAKEFGEDFDIRIFATAHQMDKVEFALSTAVKAIDFYLPYFRVPYPLPKLDMIAIPDFSANAMENWGLVTYRETALLYNESVSSTWNKQRVAVVVCHELAHMWFGNLVTMDYWEDVWLNEGFASYMEYKCVNAIYPDWGMNDQFLIIALHDVMKFDCSPASHKIRREITTIEQIGEVYDKIAYEKGASVIRMLEDVVGSEKFEQAVTNYLETFKYKNAVTNDFVNELAKLDLDFDITLFMRTWTEQMGLPVIMVNRTSPSAFLVSQKRFFSNIEDYNVNHNDSEFNYKWEIPLTYRYDSDPDIKRIWYDLKTDYVGVAVPEDTKWLKFNAHQVGFYRVNYDEGTWKAIIDNLKATPTKFDTTDRAHLLNDIFALADAGQLRYDLAMDMMDYLLKETEFVPWYVAAEILDELQARLMYTEFYTDYLKFARNLLSEAYKLVDWEKMEENHLKRRLRVSVLTAACAHGIRECIQEASRRFSEWLVNPEAKPEPDLREIVYYYGMEALGSKENWMKMWQLFVVEQDAAEKNKLMYGLAGVQEPWQLFRFIELAANDSYVRSQDYFTCLENIASNPIGEPIVWDYVREKWPELVERFDLNDRYFGRMISTITKRFSTEIKLEEMQKFFEKYPQAGAGTSARKQAIETAKFNIQWLQLNQEVLGKWLNERTKINRA